MRRNRDLIEKLRRRDVPKPGRRTAAQWRAEYAEQLRASPPAERPMAGGRDATAARGVMSRLHLEPEHVRREILRKAAAVAPAYNKGGLQYVPHEVEWPDERRQAEEADPDAVQQRRR